MQEMLDAMGVKSKYYDLSEEGFGDRYVVTFDNGFGASIVRNNMSYGGSAGLWELAVLHKSTGDNDYDLCYKTPITNDVIGWLTPDKVSVLVMEIMELGNSDLCDHQEPFPWDNPWEEDVKEFVN